MKPARPVHHRWNGYYHVRWICSLWYLLCLLQLQRTPLEILSIPLTSRLWISRTCTAVLKCTLVVQMVWILTKIQSACSSECSRPVPSLCHNKIRCRSRWKRDVRAWNRKAQSLRLVSLPQIKTPLWQLQVRHVLTQHMDSMLSFQEIVCIISAVTIMTYILIYYI